MARDAELIRAIELAGGPARLARELSERAPDRALTLQAISQWDRVPAARVLDVEAVTGVSRHCLRPDIYGPAPSEDAAA